MRDVAGQTVVVATGAASESFCGMVKLNETGKALWSALAEGLDERAIVRRMAEEYDVPSDKLEHDVAAFIARMDEAGFLEHD